MYIKVFLSNSMRLAFIGAAALIAMAFLEWAVQFLGYSLVGPWYTAGRLLEIAAALLVYVIAVLLREIREELRTKRP